MWSSHDGDVNPSLSYDEDFCIVDMGCGHVMRQLTASPEDVARLDALLAEVSFDISREEWLALLSVDVDADVDADRDAVVDADVDDSLDDDVDADVDVVLANHDAALVYHGAAPTNHDEAEREHEKQLEDAPGAGIAGALSKVRLGATGVFNDVDDLIGLASTVVYSGDFGWCGNIVVRSDYRKRGVASMVLRAALDSMGRSVTALLDASDMGLPLYSKAGFVPVSRVRRYFLSKTNAMAQAAAVAATAAKVEGYTMGKQSETAAMSGLELGPVPGQEPEPGRHGRHRTRRSPLTTSWRRRTSGGTNANRRGRRRWNVNGRGWRRRTTTGCRRTTRLQ